MGGMDEVGELDRNGTQDVSCSAFEFDACLSIPSTRSITSIIS